MSCIVSPASRRRSFFPGAGCFFWFVCVGGTLQNRSVAFSLRLQAEIQSAVPDLRSNHFGKCLCSGKIFESFYIQPAAALLCCVLAVSAFLAFFVAVFGVYFDFLNRFFSKVKIKYIIIALIVIVAVGWAVTLAGHWRQTIRAEWSRRR